jgi:hypothetical protein
MSRDRVLENLNLTWSKIKRSSCHPRVCGGPEKRIRKLEFKLDPRMRGDDTRFFLTSLGVILLTSLIHSVFAAPVNGTLPCLDNTVQFNKQNQIHFGNAQSKQPFIFLVRNENDASLILDFPAGHIGASAGLTQVLAPRGWAVYVYKPAADTLLTDKGAMAPFWSCAMQTNTGQAVAKECQHNVYYCALTRDSAKMILSTSYLQQADNLSHSFWLPVGNAQYQSINFLTDLQKNSQ